MKILIKYLVPIYNIIVKLNINNLFFFIYFVKLCRVSIFFYLKSTTFNKKNYKEKLDFTLNLLIENIYNKIYKIRSSLFFVLSFCIYIYSINKNILWNEFYCLLFLIGASIKLITIIYQWNNDYKTKEKFYLYHYIIKYILIILLLFIILLLLVIGFKFIISIITLLKMNILNRLKHLNESLEYKRSNLKNKPKNPKFNFISFWKKKKERKKALNLKNKILQIQNNNNNNKIHDLNITPFNEKRNWNEKINIEKIPTFSSLDQLNNVEHEFKAYDNQEKKFKKIISNINKKKENFFPDESKYLFKEYVTVIKVLKKNLNQ